MKLRGWSKVQYNASYRNYGHIMGHVEWTKNGLL